MLELELFVAVGAGILVGIVTGLAPGIHVNLVCALLLAAFPFVPLSPLGAVVFIIAIATTHTFLDAVPSVFLGAPSTADVLSVLPGHRYLLRGEGLVAVRLSNLGALLGLVAGTLVFPVFELVTRWFALIPKGVFGWVLVAIPVLVALRDARRFAALGIAALAGVYGWFALKQPDPLFPMLGGLFGAATLLASFGEVTRIPPQGARAREEMPWSVTARVVGGGLLAGGLTAVLPGLGAAHAAIVGMFIAAGSGDAGFLLVTGVIGTTNFFLSLAAYNAVGSARNGALATATVIEPSFPVAAGVGAALFAGGVAFLVTGALGGFAARVIERLPYKTLTVSVLGGITVLVAVLNGFPGLVAFAAGTAIGLLAPLTGAARAHAMSCILVPVGFRFIGF
jgi:putative membrane protein